jgi:hypothetical protein
METSVPIARMTVSSTSAVTPATVTPATVAPAAMTPTVLRQGGRRPEQ